MREAKELNGVTVSLWSEKLAQTLYLPRPQKLVTDERYLGLSGEALDGPYISKFRECYTYIKIECLDVLNGEGLSYDGIMNALYQHTNVTEIQESPLVFTASYNGNIIYNYSVIIEGHNLLHDVNNTGVRTMLFSFIGSHRPIIYNYFNSIGRTIPVPITTGRFKV